MPPISYRDHFDGQHVAAAHELIRAHADASDVAWMRDALDWFVDVTVELLDDLDDPLRVALAIKVRLALAAGEVPSNA
jgi:hypothetical protein